MTSTAEQAAEKAKRFLADQGYVGAWIKLESALYDKDAGTWILTYDVGAVTKKLTRITLEAQSGHVQRMEPVQSQ